MTPHSPQVPPVTVDAPPGVTVKVSSHIRHLCPFVDEIDHGQMTASWVTVDRTIEAHSLRAYLNGYTKVRVSHEALAVCINEDLTALDGIEEVVVTVEFDTAGFTVEARS